MKHKTSTRRTRSAIFLAAAATAASGLVGIAGTGTASAADQSVSMELTYTCDFPLVGTQDMKAKISASGIPEERRVVDETDPPDTEVPLFPIDVEAEIGAETTAALNLMGAKHIEAAAKGVTADALVALPARSLNIKTLLDVAAATVPETGKFPVKASGMTPQTFTSDAEGWGAAFVKNFTMKVTPTDADHKPTALGTIDVQCYQKPGANPHNTLVQIWFKATTPMGTPPAKKLTPTDPPPVYKDSTAEAKARSVSLIYRCPLPALGFKDFPISASMKFPDQINAREYAPAIQIDATGTLTTDIMSGIHLIENPTVGFLKGNVVATAPITVPDVPTPPLNSQIKMPFADITVPSAQQDPNHTPIPVPVSGTAPKLVFKKDGDGRIDVGRLVMNLVIETPDHQLHPELMKDKNGVVVPVLPVTCNLKTTTPPQNNTMVNFKIGQGGGGDTQKPTVPTGLASTGKDSSSVSLKWDASTDNVGVTGYKVKVTKAGAAVKTVDVPGTTAKIDGLAASTEYGFSVSAYDAAKNESDFSGEEKVTTDDPPGDTQKPTVPTGLASTGKDSSSVSLKWNASTDNVGVTGYKVNVTKAGAAVKTVDVPGTGTTAKIDELAASTEYGFSVSAYDAAKNESDFSGEEKVTTDDPPGDTQKPTVPTGLASTGKDSSSVSLKWNASTDNVGVTGYKVKVTMAGAAVKTVDVPGTGTTAKIDGLAASTEYGFSVSAYDAAKNESDFSGEEKVTTDDPPGDTQKPTVPTGLASTGKDSSSVSLKWNASTDNVGVTGYKVKVTKAGAAVKTVDVPGTGTTAKIDGLAASTEYGFSVSAYDAAKNESDFSAEEKVTTDDPPGDTQKPSVPTGLASTGKDSSSVSLKWNASTDNVGVTGYKVKVTKAGAAVKTVDVPGTGTTAKIDGLAASTEYGFSVSAYDAAKNESAFSAEVKETTTGGGGVRDFLYKLTGTSHIKAPNGDVTLSGGIKGKVGADGKYTGDLTLNNTSGKFNLLGFLPATADITFTQVGQTTGTLSAKNLTSNSKMTVKLPKVKVFGLEIGGGATCQTTSPADISLKSDNFTEAAGGTLTGSYTLPGVSGCGPLTQLISALVAGPGNTVSVTLKP